MKNSVLYYSVGPLLYCPANNESIVNSIVNEKFGHSFSLALCLEDTINDDFVPEAESILIQSLLTIFNKRKVRDFFLPKIFIRIRNAEQILRLSKNLGSAMEIVTGYILPKFSPENADSYIQNIIKVNEFSHKPVYTMPIYENSCIIDLRKRYDTLYLLKDKLSSIEELVLNIRVGGNDLCHAFGFRRHVNESIHCIKPVSNIFTDIITVYGQEYVISGPVWEYYDGPNWKQGLINEIYEDKLCGFTGKTVIHPNQVEVVNDCYRVLRSDYEDAKSILGWNCDNASFVSGSVSKVRMNEKKTHENWAQQTLWLAEAFGIKE